jgi:hypothetical protein
MEASETYGYKPVKLRNIKLKLSVNLFYNVR